MLFGKSTIAIPLYSVRIGTFTTFGCVIKQTTVRSMQSERGLSIITPHCLEWYKLVPCTRLPTPAVRYLILTCVSAGHIDELRLRLLSIDDVLHEHSNHPIDTVHSYD